MRTDTMTNETLLGAVIGAVTGAGGLGGLWALLGKRQESDAKLIGQYYGDLSSRLTSLEHTVLSQQETIGILRADNAELRAVNGHLQSEIEELRAENTALRHRVDGLADHGEVCE